MKKALFVCAHNAGRSQMADDTDQIITMGCTIDAAYPAAFLPAEDRGLDDPAGQPMATVRRIRYQVRVKVAELLGQES